MNARLLFVPGLVRRHVEGGWLTSLRQHPPARSARLVCGFPGLPRVLEATLRSGKDPAGHGVHDRTRALDPDDDRLTALGIAFHPWTRLGETLREHGPYSPRESETLLALDRWCAQQLRADAGPTLLAGGPSHSPCDTCLDVEETLVAFGARSWTLESSTLWVDVEEARAADLREELLHLDGVERVLLGVALGRLGCDPARGVVALACAGVAFEPVLGCYGHAEADPGEEPVLLGWNLGGRWPAAVHDVRVAPTLAALAGQAPREGEEPLPVA